jgi:hypothetical protein
MQGNADRNLAFAFALISFVIRIPFCIAAPGFDPDSYLFLFKAVQSVETGQYIPSRPPGYIVADHIGHLLAPHGWLYLNLLTSLTQSLTIPIFATILRELQVPYRNWALFLYAFLPLHLVAYADVMIEYPLMLLGILLGWLYAIRRNYIFSALLIGAGAAIRPSQGIFIVAMFAVFCIKHFGWRAFASWISFSGLMLLLLWVLPTAWLVDYRMIFDYLPYPFEIVQYAKHIALRFIGPFGILPLLALAYGFLRYNQSIWKRLRNDIHLPLSLLIVAVIVATFFRHPFKTNYLLVALPFLFYAVFTVFEERLIKVFATLSLVHGFIGVPSMPQCSPLRLVGVGVIIADYYDRKILRSEAYHMLETVPSKSIVFVTQNTFYLLSYDALRNKKVAYEIIKSSIIYDRYLDKWFTTVCDDRITKLINGKFKNYKIFSTDAWYRRSPDIKKLKQLGVLDRVHRLHTSRCL